jgi:proteasome lid subunit RPN8/RPN11
MGDSALGGPANRGQLTLREALSDDACVTSLILPTALRNTMVRYLRRCLPHEGVGLLATRSIGSSLTAIRFYPGRNMDRSPRRFTMDPADVLPALADMRRDKTRFGAIVHSHPNTVPVPSRTDLVEATVPGVLSLIVGFSPVVELLAWSLVYDAHGATVRFDEVPVVCHESRQGAPLGYLRRAGHKS